ncbi:MAG: hypothetical protein ACR2PZ_02440 [Pseudomonadales bacterium]
MYKSTSRWLPASLWAALALLFANSATAQTASLFASDNLEPLQVRITGPLRAIARDRASEPEERSGTLALLDDAQSFSVTLRPRGKSRRDPNHCRFPPMWVKFDKGEVKRSALAGHHRRKLVTHCKRLKTENSDDSKVWLEMLAYRTLNLLTETSFRVQPLLITYEDSDKPGKTYRHAGFFIEHKKELARRLDLQLDDLSAVPIPSLDPDYTALAALFNMFIGNPDFSARHGPADDNCCHNTVPFTVKPGVVRSVPYDFDNTGLVFPPYATTSERLRIKSVAQRIYRGYCQHNASIAASMALFVDKRGAIEELFQTYPGISKSERKRVLKFVARFFERYATPEGQKQHITQRCMGKVSP